MKRISRLHVRPIGRTVGRLALLWLGTAILAFGLYNIHAQSGVTEGGVLGLTLLFYHHFGISPGISGICIDAVCYLLGLRLLGKAFLKNAILASLGFSFFCNLFERFGYVLPDFSDKPLIAALLGALFVGVGVGIVVRMGGACGGDDALALIISKVTHLRISFAYFFTDFVVLMLSLTYIPYQKILWSLLTVLLSSLLIDLIKSIGTSRKDHTVSK